MPRESAYGRLLRHFHEHPHGRRDEVLFYLGIGLVLGGGAFLAWRFGKLSTPLAMIAGIVALCIAGFGALPQRKARPRPPPPGQKRAAIAEQVRRSKAEKKKKGGGPPPPPIRRG